MKTVCIAALCLFIGIWATGCDSHNSTTATAGADRAAAANEIPRTYQVHGVVKKLEPDGKTALIQHEEVPGFMMAMTMPFDVKNTNELRGLRAGDSVLFRLNITEKDGWIDQVRVLSNSAPLAPETNEITRFVPVSRVLKSGDPLPDYVFTNELGQVIRLADFRGQAIAFTFIFTRCPYPDFCPRVTDNLSRTLKELRKRQDAPTNFHLFSITFDPGYDTPATLKAYGSRFNYDPAKWSLLTGDFEQIEKIAGNFELFFAKNVPVGQQNHNLRTVVVDTKGIVRAVLPSNDWEVGDLVEAIVAAAKGK
jgi:protein SCO1/2